MLRVVLCTTAVVLCASTRAGICADAGSQAPAAQIVSRYHNALKDAPTPDERAELARAFAASLTDRDRLELARTATSSLTIAVPAGTAAEDVAVTITATNAANSAIFNSATARFAIVTNRATDCGGVPRIVRGTPRRVSD